ncbi:EipA family protein, partial [Stenotrophomonas maltophilia]|uniref:EipA family protein n=1 Tax=Stenotrophomonas maltophilia TaxID=40324 RepID=UPI0013DB222A
ANLVERATQQWGQPSAYILGQEGSGAFVAGLLLAETEYRRAIEATLEPFKGLLLGAFFFSVGLSIDLSLIATRPLVFFGALVVLVGLK